MLFAVQESELKLDKEYRARALAPGLHVTKKYVGEFSLDSGLQVYLRSFNVFNLTLWDDVMAQFGELQDDDILVRCPHLSRLMLCRRRYLNFALLALLFLFPKFSLRWGTDASCCLSVLDRL